VMTTPLREDLRLPLPISVSKRYNATIAVLQRLPALLRSATCFLRSVPGSAYAAGIVAL
jgi:hypothetical protein